MSTCYPTNEKKNNRNTNEKQVGRRRRADQPKIRENKAGSASAVSKGDSNAMNSIFSFLSSPTTPTRKNASKGRGKASKVPPLKNRTSPRTILDRLDENNHDRQSLEEDISSTKAMVAGNGAYIRATCVSLSSHDVRSQFTRNNPQNKAFTKTNKQQTTKQPLLQIIKLNNQGVDAFKSQRFDFSMKLLLVAHRQCLSFFKRESIETRSDLSSTKTKQARTHGTSHSRRHPGDCVVDDNVFTASAPAPNMNNYIYQRIDFDEGMNTYNTPEQIDESCQDHHLILSLIWYNMSHLHRQADALDNAMDCLEHAKKLFEIHEKMTCKDQESEQISKPTHFFTSIAILQAMGQILYRQGDLLNAIKKYENSLIISKQAFGNDHSTTASAFNSLGVLYYHLHSSNKHNMPENALALAHSYSDFALSIRKTIFGENHADVGTVYNNIGRLYVLKDEFIKALDCYERALQIRRTVLGKDSLDYAATAFNAGQSYHQISNGDRAMELYHEFLRVAVKHFSKNHRDVAVVLSGIAHIHQDKGEYDEALRLYKESLEASRNALGNCHPEVAMILNRIGNFHFERGNYDAAFEAYSKGLEIEKKVLENDHGNIIVTLSNLGEIHRQRFEWDEAIKVFKVVLQMQRKRYGKEHPEIATSLHVIGMTYDKKGETDLALSFLQSALIMRRKLHGDNNLDVAFTLSALGTIFSRGSKFKLALDLFHEALRVRKSLLGPNHCDVAFSLYNIALIHFKQGSFNEAVEGFGEALKVEKHVLGENHKDVAITLYKLGETYRKNDQLEMALTYFKQALKIERRTMGEEDQITIARTLTEIGNIHLARGESALMMEAFIEAGRIYQSCSLSPDNVIVHGHQYPFEVVFPENAPCA